MAETLRETLEQIYDIYNFTGPDDNLSQDLLDTCQNVLELWPENPKLERAWRDYDEYFSNEGSNSVLFENLFNMTLSWVNVNLA